MNPLVIREQLLVIEGACDIINESLFDVIVKPGDNLPSIIASTPANSVIGIDNLYHGKDDLVIDKPLSLMAKTPTQPGRIDLKANLPINEGKVTITGPNVNLVNLDMVGVDQSSQILTLGDNSTILQCIAFGGINGQHRAVWADAKNMTIKDSYIGNIIADIDAQAIFCFNGCNGLKVVNTYLEATGENFLAGGADADSVDKIPQNIEFDNCDFFKPLAWFNVHSVKNLFELKCAKHVRVKNSRFTNCWTSGQTGYGILFTVRNQGGTAPFSTIEDVEFDNCEVDNVGAGVQILAVDDSQISDRLSGLTLKNMKFNINTALGAGRTYQIQAGPDKLHINKNIVTISGELNSFFSFLDPSKQCTNFEFNGNEFQEGDYGIIGADISPNLGVYALNSYAPGYSCNNNIVHKGAPPDRFIQYPPCITVI